MPQSWQDPFPNELLRPFVPNSEAAQQDVLELREMKGGVIYEAPYAKTMRQIHKTFPNHVLIGLGLQLSTGRNDFVLNENLPPIIIYIYKHMSVGSRGRSNTNILIASRAPQLMRLLNSGRLL